MKKQLIAAALITAMFASLASCGKSSKAADDTNYIYGQIESISGNDVVLNLADEKEDKSSGEESETETGSSDKKAKHSGRNKGEKPEGFTRSENGEMPSGFDPENFNGEMPEGFSRPENGEKPERGGNNSKYTLTGEQEEVRIPVGTDVTTSDGVKTDFDALKAGNIIKCSVEKDSDGKDVVKEVWIVE
ncbi:MAG: hypothetical protein K5884_03460 [Ruminococcus sp.]|nr:hypothetical protein [Ruminococcus sp.]